MSYCGTLQGPVTCLGHVDVSWFMVIRDLRSGGIARYGKKFPSRLDCSGGKVPVGRFGLDIVRRLVW